MLFLLQDILNELNIYFIEIPKARFGNLMCWKKSVHLTEKSIDAAQICKRKMVQNAGGEIERCWVA